LGADGGYGLGYGVVGGAGISVHRDGSINTDSYIGHGGVLGYMYGGGVTFDNMASGPGVSVSTRPMISAGAVFVSGTIGGSNAEGVAAGVTFGPGAGALFSGARVTTLTIQREPPRCPSN
jgi:hypothetical protein